MAGDKYSAIWVSHTSMSDFLIGPKYYYLKNMYRDKKTGHKIKLMSPPLALGQAVHEVLDTISKMPTKDRLKESLVLRFQDAWEKVSGKKGGFLSQDAEQRYKKRGEEMLLRVMNNPGPVAHPAVKIKEELPHYWLSEEKNLILCGKVDWLEYIEENDSVHIIDFKTSSKEEKDGSLQLPIYHLLVHNTQKRDVSKASYWYLSFNDSLTPKILPDLKEAEEAVMDIAMRIRAARELNRFPCDTALCEKCCEPLERVIRGEAEYVGVDDYNADVYIHGSEDESDDAESIIL